MYLIFWWISEAVRFSSIYDQIYRVLGNDWSYSEDRLPEDKCLVNEWQKTSLAMIDAHFDRTNTFEVVDESTGILTYEDAKRKVVVLKMEDIGRVFDRCWPPKYKPKGLDRLPLLLPKPKITKSTDQERNMFWRTRPQNIDADQWKSFERFANVCRDGRTDVAEELLTRIDVVEIMKLDYNANYTVKFVDRKLRKVWVKKFPNYLFEKRNAVEYYSDEEHVTLVATGRDPGLYEEIIRQDW